MRNNVFTYGSLTIPEVMNLVAAESPKFKPATLANYRCSLILNKNYPGIIKEPEQITKGIVYYDLSDQSLSRLDYFEDNVYERQKVIVETTDGMVEAYAYVLPQDQKHVLSDFAWNEENFKKEHLTNFLTWAEEWMEGYFYR